jgi:hypothetical protein
MLRWMWLVVALGGAGGAALLAPAHREMRASERTRVTGGSCSNAVCRNVQYVRVSSNDPQWRQYETVEGLMLRSPFQGQGQYHQDLSTTRFYYRWWTGTSWCGEHDFPAEAFNLDGQTSGPFTTFHSWCGHSGGAAESL